ALRLQVVGAIGTPWHPLRDPGAWGLPARRLAWRGRPRAAPGDRYARDLGAYALAGLAPALPAAVSPLRVRYLGGSGGEAARPADLHLRGSRAPSVPRPVLRLDRVRAPAGHGEEGIPVQGSGADALLRGEGSGRAGAGAGAGRGAGGRLRAAPRRAAGSDRAR